MDPAHLVYQHHHTRIGSAAIGLVTTWHCSRDGLSIYTNGLLVAVVPFSQFGALVYDLARAMR